MRVLVFFLVIFFSKTVSADEPNQQCRIIVGAEASRIVGSSKFTAVNYCSSLTNSKPTFHLLSSVWQTPEGVCHFLEDTSPLANGVTPEPVPTEIGIWMRSPQRYTLYSSFASKCNLADSKEYFPVVAIINDEVISKIGSMWRALNSSDEQFKGFARKFDAATDGAAKNWRRNSLQIRFLDMLNLDAPWWRRLFSSAQQSYILGLKDGSGNLYMATVEVKSEVVIQSIVPSVR